MFRTIPVINNKGGVGKTTTSVNLAAGLALQDRRVLLIDLDSQGSASLALGVERGNLTPSSASVLFEEVGIREAIRPTQMDNLHLVTGSLDLADADMVLSDMPGRERRLEAVLGELDDDYDVIIIDCAPSTSLLSVNALVAADAFIIPLSPSYLALEGIISLGEVVKNVRLGIGEVAPVLGIVLTMVDYSNERTAEIVEQVRQHYGGKVFHTEIKPDPKLEDAPGFGQSIFEFAPQSPGADDYRRLTAEVIERLARYGAVYDQIRSQSGAASGSPLTS
jgi:chromosome partitioning protein